MLRLIFLILHQGITLCNLIKFICFIFHFLIPIIKIFIVLLKNNQIINNIFYG